MDTNNILPRCTSTGPFFDLYLKMQMHESSAPAWSADGHSETGHSLQNPVPGCWACDTVIFKEIRKTEPFRIFNFMGSCGLNLSDVSWVRVSTGEYLSDTRDLDDIGMLFNTLLSVDDYGMSIETIVFNDGSWMEKGIHGWKHLKTPTRDGS